MERLYRCKDGDCGKVQKESELLRGSHYGHPLTKCRYCRGNVEEIRSHRPTDRTPGSESGNFGSIPNGSTDHTGV